MCRLPCVMYIAKPTGLFSVICSTKKNDLRYRQLPTRPAEWRSHCADDIAELSLVPLMSSLWSALSSGVSLLHSHVLSLRWGSTVWKRMISTDWHCWETCHPNNALCTGAKRCLVDKSSQITDAKYVAPWVRAKHCRWAHIQFYVGLRIP